MRAEDLASPGSGSWGRASVAGLSEAWRCWDGAVTMSAARRWSRPGPRGRLETGPELAATMRLSRGFGHKDCGDFGGSVDIAPTLVMERRLPLQDPVQVSLA
ncbi:hypothetical protein JMM63_04545 [Rhodovulum sulfidophilum]|uniref:hypothetical protein n=1 Tax=Rhodovulum sulfidophilum TaxID=35806 RepID=UPI00095FB2BA|nr:hypothetical protein [Rhodovulum sulfidophilum]MBL3594844.1 hypothetical protein [Rhodovulum sulfidophilum]OLS53468.1 hypothetical protein BV392_16775 [Rhodovulum sulfidophilum]